MRVETPRTVDILSGRGNDAKHHPGMSWFQNHSGFLYMSFHFFVR